MKLRKLGNNVTLLSLEDVEVLFSYETPVAGFVSGSGLIRTAKHFSPTTTRHINKWLEGRTATEVPHRDIMSLLKPDAYTTRRIKKLS